MTTTKEIAVLVDPDTAIKKPEGTLIVPECQIAPIMESLALGIAPDVYGRTPLDAVRTVGPNRLNRIAKIRALSEVRYNGLVEADSDGWFIWRPDPEYDCDWGYRAHRYLKARSLGTLLYPGGTREWAEIHWDSGHGAVSTFLCSILRFGVAGDPARGFTGGYADKEV